MPKRRLAVVVLAGAMMVMAFSLPGRLVQSSHRTSMMHAVWRANSFQASSQVQWTSSYHYGTCHEQDVEAYNPADD